MCDPCSRNHTHGFRDQVFRRWTVPKKEGTIFFYGVGFIPNLEKCHALRQFWMEEGGTENVTHSLRDVRMVFSSVRIVHALGMPLTLLINPKLKFCSCPALDHRSFVSFRPHTLSLSLSFWTLISRITLFSSFRFGSLSGL